MKGAAKVLLVVILIALAIVPTARAQLASVGPVDPITGFPTFIQDASGLLLGACDDGDYAVESPPCVSTTLRDPLGGFVAGNIAEAVFYAASAEIRPVTGERFLLTGMVEALLAPPEQVDNIVLIRLRNLVVEGAYSVVTPWGAFGPFNVVAPAPGQPIPDREAILISSGIAPTFAGVLTGLVQNFFSNGTGIPGFFGDGVTAAPLVIPAGVTLPPGAANVFRVIGPPGVGTQEIGDFTVEGKIAGLIGTTPLTPGRATFSRTGKKTGRALIFAESLVGAIVSVTADVAGNALPGQPVALTAVTGEPGTFIANIPLTDADTQLPTQVQVTAVFAPATPTTMTVRITDTVFISKADFNFNTKKLAVTAKSTDQRPAKARSTLQAFDQDGTLLGTLNNYGNLNIALPVIPEFVEVRSSSGGSARVAPTFK